MRHAYFGRKLHRTTNERQQLFRNLLRALIAHGSITTTIAKAKSVAPAMEKLITKAKIGTEYARRELFADLGGDKETTHALMEMAKTRFSKRTSGYTRLIKLGLRQGDAAEMAELSFTDAPLGETKTTIQVDNKTTKTTKMTKRIPAKK